MAATSFAKKKSDLQTEELSMETQDTVLQEISSPPTPDQRKKYQSPKLIEFGSLAELTKLGGDGAADGITASLSTG
jgi:hypothetical protein